MSEDGRDSEEQRLRALLDEVMTLLPEFGLVRLWSQFLEVVIDYDRGDLPREVKSIYVRGAAVIRYADDARTITFAPPLGDLSGNVPSVIFGLEGERITAINLTSDSLTIRTSKASVAFSFNVGPGEAIHIGRKGEDASFYL